MLEVKNLTKVYRTKGGAEVRALDDVSVAFGEKGMVFLLGRSGSGKSTLLNMCGGLDSPDSGEIIVKGRSSKDFSAGDFDSYRNTYVGFIFQEYNILNEFSVEDNIALALELQGKPKDKAEIARLLEEVDLTDFAKRKPNTLSGGQKQRVAIARALVKNPEIIMADEPTGALDSNTGKQVLDTLKKLAENKLVIVVSHDRDFAEEYGDRIIELKDGKIISDVVKEYVPAEVKDDNVSVLSGNTLFVKKGSKLSDKDFTKIKKFLSECDNDVMISRDKDNIDGFKKANKISEDNSKERFTALTAQPEQRRYTEEENKFIRSKLPLRHAVKIGASGIRVKPVRFTFTVILSVVAFVLFGLFSCLMLYDAQEMKVQSLKDSGTQYLNLYKFYETKTVNYDSSSDEPWQVVRPAVTNISDSDLDNVRQSLGNNSVPVYKLSPVSISNLTLDERRQSLYDGRIYGFVPADAPIQYLAGGAPADGKSIAISEYLFDSIKAGTLKDENLKEINVNTYEDVKIQINGKTYGVSGIFACEKVPEKYEKLANEDDTTGRWSNTLREGFYAYAAIAPSAFDDFAQITGIDNSQITENNFGGTIVFYNYSDVMSGATSNQHTILTAGESYYNSDLASVTVKGDEKSSVVINYSSYFKILKSVCDVYAQDKENTDFINDYFKLTEDYAAQFDSLCSGDAYSLETMLGYAKTILDVTNKYFRLENTEINVVDFVNKSVIAKVNVIGFTFTGDTSVLSLDASYSFDVATAYKEYCKDKGTFAETTTTYNPTDYEKAMYSHVFVPTGDTASGIKAALTYNTQLNDKGERYEIANGLLSELDYYNMLVSILSKVFLWVGIALAIFSMLLLFNFITTSISAKKKEIGILRAVGARGTDVFKIFFSEAFIIAAMCIILSIILTGVFAGLINNSIENEIGIPFSMFNFGILSVLMIIGIALVSAFISTIFPVYANAKKKPVESIRSL